MRILLNGVRELAVVLAGSIAGISGTLNLPIAAFIDGGASWLVAVIALITLLSVWLAQHSGGSESDQDEAEVDREPKPGDQTAKPSVWTKGRDPTTLGDSRTTEENTTNPPKPDSKPTDETPQTSSEAYEFNWETSTDVSMNDVGGMDDLKRELETDVIKPLTTGKEKAEKLDIPLPNILFHGPPGTGKTYTAKALATELGLPFAKLSGSDVQSKWINESAQKINKLFAEAKRVAESEGGAVVFLDELDSVLKRRSGAGRSHEEDNKVVAEFLTHLQETGEHDILFVGATNRLKALDEAGIRSGRIDKTIEIGKPDAEARTAIIRAQLSDRPHSLTDEHIEALAQATEGAVAADLESIIVEAARNCAFERGGEVIRWTDFEQG